MIICQQTRGLLSSNDQLALDLQFAADKTLTSRTGPTPTFTRASSGTFVNSSGFIEVASNNTPRFDHDPITLESKGLIIEESRTNLIPWSTAFNEPTSWTAIRLVSLPAANTHIGPDGALTAEKLIPSSVSGDHRIDRPTISSLVSGTIYTVSAFVKADGYTGFAISVGSAPSASPTRFNLQDGVVTSTPSGWTAKIEPYPDGWYRCSTTFTWTSGNRVYFYVGQTPSAYNYVGDETSGILIWGAQFEAGQFATSYIPTTGGPAVRSADVCGISGADFDNIYNDTQWTIITDAAAIGFTTSNNGIVRIAGVSSLYNRAAQVNRLTAGLFADQLTPSSNYNTAGFFYKSAISADVLGADYVIDGTQIPDTFTGGSLTPTSSLLTFNDIPLARCNNWIKSFRYYRRIMPVPKLQALTAS